MPQTSDNIIISGAGDSEIRIFDLTNTEKQLDSMYVCHSDQLKKICVYDNNPFEFLSCSQDGTVRHFDRRTPHICSPHNVRSFITAQSKPARQHPLPECKNLRFGCSNPVVDYGQYNIELNSMTISKLFPHYFAVAGMNDYIYLHDSRMTSSGGSAAFKNSSTSNKMEKLKCIKRFSPTIDGLNRPEKHITACKFSDTNGYELLGSWSSDGIYLFNINDDTIQSSVTNNSSSSSSSSSNSNNRVTSNNDLISSAEISSTELLRQKKSAWEDIFLVMEYGLAKNAIASFCEFLQKNHPTLDLDSRIGIACVNMMNAHEVCTARIRRDDWYTDTINDPELSWSRYFFENELTKIQQYMEDAAAMVLPTETWQAYWCLGIGYWTLRGGHQSIGNENRKSCLDKSLEYVKKAQEVLSQAQEAAPSSSSSSSNTANVEENTDNDYSQINGTYSAMIHLFIIDWEHAAVREGYLTNEETQIEECGVSCWSWEQLMYITLYKPEDIEDFFVLDLTAHNEETDEETDTTSATTTSGQDADQDEQMTEDDVSLYTRIMSRQIMDIYRGGSIGEESEDSDLDLEELAVLRESTQQVVEADVGVVKPRMKYTGHSNIEVIYMQMLDLATVLLKCTFPLPQLDYQRC